MDDKVETVYTVMDYLPAKVKFDIPKAAMLAILADRGVVSQSRMLTLTRTHCALPTLTC